MTSVFCRRWSRCLRSVGGLGAGSDPLRQHPSPFMPLERGARRAAATVPDNGICGC